MKIKKVLSLVLLLSLVTLVLAGCGTSQEKKSSANDSAASNTKFNQANTVRVAIQPYPLYAPIYVAKSQGTLEKELSKIGVKVEWSSFKSGPLVNESFAGGQQDIGVLGDVPAIIARASGQKNLIVGNAAYGEKALAVLVKSNSKITTASELKGKKVAYVKGSYAHHLISIVLKNSGLSFNDIESVNLAAGDIPAALETGDVDAGVLWEPFITQLVNQGRAKVLVDGTGIKRGNLVIIATEKYATENPAVIEAFLKVYNEAYKYIDSNPDEAAKLIANEFGLTPQELTEVFKNFHYNPVITQDDIDELKVVESFLQEQQLTSEKVNIDEFVDKSYLVSN